MLLFLDALAPGMLAQAVDGWGTTSNPGVVRPAHRFYRGAADRPLSPPRRRRDPGGTLFHPLFWYELLWNLAGAAVIVLLEQHKLRQDGRITPGTGRSLGMYLLWYGAGRAVLESIRWIPPSRLAGC